MNGHLFAIEGIDAAGKATQSRLLAEFFKEKGFETHLISFPRYESPTGRAILRHLKGEIMTAQHTPFSKAPEDALAFQCLMTADKYAAAPEISNWLRNGDVVICDRWWPSACAYGAADGIPLDWLLNVHLGLPQAKAHFLLDVAPGEALVRRPEARDRYERDREKQEKVRSQYLNLWQTMNAQRNPAVPTRWWIKVDGAQPVDHVASELSHKAWDTICFQMVV
jgi:dTMP kinase